ncbi:hypothetical protein H4S02_005521, partial [Coemansia sp. RSA 2611]
LRDPDQDLRAMAASDLLDLLKKSSSPFSRDDGERCTAAFVKLLYDAQSHVQNLGMECLGQVVRLIDAEITRATVSSICSEIQQRGKSSESTALSVGLRVMSNRVAEDTEDRVLLGSLATAIVSVLKDTSDLPSDVAVDVFSALSDVLTHAGAQVAMDTDTVNQIQETLLSYIGHSNMGVRRRAIAVLGAFVVHVPGKQSEQALGTIFQRYEACTRPSEKCIMLRVLVTIARQRPERVAKLVPSIVDRELGSMNEDEHEVRVTMLLVFETFVRHCTEPMAPRRDEIYNTAVEALKYDPNYNYDAEDDMDTGSEAGEDFGDEYEDDIYEDEEDDSWDVRLSGVKLLAAIAKSGLYTPSEVVQRIGDVLGTSFKEREDVVRAEVLTTYAAMVTALNDLAAGNASEMVNVLQQQAPKVVASSLAAIKSYPRSVETKQLAFAIFARLASVKQDILDSSLSDIAPLVSSALEAEDISGTLQTASNSLVKTNLKLDVIEFLHSLAQRSAISNSAVEFFASAKDGIKRNVTSKTFQVPSASFNTATSLVLLLGRASADVGQFVSWADDMARDAASLTSTDDQGLKRSVYGFIGTVLQQLGDKLGASSVDQLLGALATLTGGVNDSPIVLGAFVQAVSQPTALPAEKVAAVAPSVLQSIEPLFRQNSMAAVTVALDVVKVLADYGADTVAPVSEHMLDNIIAVISRTPESPPASALQAFAAVCPSVSEDSMRSITSEILKLLSTTTVYDGQSALALSEVFQVVGRTFPGLASSWKDTIIDNWTQTHARYAKQRKDSSNEAIQVPFPSTMLTNAAKSINALFAGYYESQGQQWSSELLDTIVRAPPKTTSEIALVCLGLRALGYAAAKGDLARSENLAAQLDAHIQSEHDDVRNEAAAALGKYVGSYPDTFSALFASATTPGSGGAAASSRLQAVKVAVEQIVGVNHDQANAEPMWSQIVAYAQSEQGALPDALAQSLATFAVALPGVFVPALVELISSSTNTNVKAFFITTFRTVLADRHLGTECDAQIKSALIHVLASIDDENVDIRRLSLLALYAVIKSKACLLDDGIIGAIEPALFKQTVINESLVRIINMGPIKKRIDDGLDARRCAFQCVHMLVRMLPGAASDKAVADSVVRGIADDHDIRLLVLQIIHETSSSLAAAYAARLDDIAESVKKVQDTKLPPKAVEQEIEKHHAMLRSSVSVLVAMEPIAKNASSAKFDELLAAVADPSSGELAGYLKELRSKDI